jgi:hypothetical protein
MAIAKLFQGLLSDVAIKSADVPAASAAVPEDFVINPAKTQRANTLPTYQKAFDLLGVKEGDDVLDYGAGMGLGAEAASLRGANVTTFEPFPQKDFEPTYKSPQDVPAESASKVLNMNVLNVLPPEERAQAVLTIGKALRPGGEAIINVRPATDVNAAKNKTKEADGWIVGTGSERTFQKGFTQKELKEYIQETLGGGFIVEDVKGLTGPSVKITKIPQEQVSYEDLANPNPFPSTVEGI